MSWRRDERGSTLAEMLTAFVVLTISAKSLEEAAMSSRRLRSALIDQRGIALPLSLIVLTLLTSLTLALLVMSSTEPLIAANLKWGEEALAVSEAGIERAMWALANSAVPTYGLANPLPAPSPSPYDGGTLVALGGSGAYTINVAAGAGPSDRTITARGYVVRNGVVIPTQLAQLAQPDIAAVRTVQLRVTVSSVGGAPINAKLPGALTVAGTVQLSGNSLVDGKDKSAGTANGCVADAGITIRQKTKLSDGTVLTNSIQIGGSGSAVGTPAQQVLAGDQSTSTFQQYLFTDAQLAALKALAQSHGKYIQPSSNTQFDLKDVPGSVSGDGTIWGPGIVDGLMFVDTVGGQPLGSPPDASKLASVKITQANNSGWLIVMGTIKIDGNVTYNGLVYAHNDFSYKGTGTGGIYGAVLSANAVDSVATIVDTDDSGNSKIYYDCTKVANGGGGLSSGVLTGLNNSIVTTVSGTWKEEVSN